MSKGPLVRKKPRARNKDGTWRKKRSDAVAKARTRSKQSKPTLDNIPLIIEDRRVRMNRLCKEIQDMTKEGMI